MSEYDDIINLPHHVSVRRPQMSLLDRAAQFSPFAALVGFYDTLAESNRQTEQFAEFTEDYLQELDEKLQYVAMHLAEQPLIEVTYFVPDSVKSGGAYKTFQGNVKQIDYAKRLICFADNRKIDVNSVTDIILK